MSSKVDYIEQMMYFVFISCLHYVLSLNQYIGHKAFNKKHETFHETALCRITCIPRI